MRYRLRTLLIALALGPVVLYGMWLDLNYEVAVLYYVGIACAILLVAYQREKRVSTIPRRAVKQSRRRSTQ